MQDPIEFGLPHRAPFVFIDGVVEVVPGESAHCVKTFAADEPFFAGHFPGNPLVPGVILTEALAQTAGIAGGGASEERVLFFLSAVRSMKFFRAVRPGELVHLRATKTGAMGALYQFAVTATVNDETVAEGGVILNAVSQE